MTLKNIRIVAGFAVITVCQLAVGMWVVILAALEGGEVWLSDLRTTFTQGVDPHPCDWPV